MISPELEPYLQTLLALVSKRRMAAQHLAQGLGMKPEEIWYAYRLGKQHGFGDLANGGSFFFHGLACAVKVHGGPSVDVEFGPQGRCDSFDKDTICLEFGFSWQNDRVFKQLESAGVVALANAPLFDKLNKVLAELARSNKQQTPWQSELEHIDAMVSHRYVLTTQFAAKVPHLPL